MGGGEGSRTSPLHRRTVFTILTTSHTASVHVQMRFRVFFFIKKLIITNLYNIRVLIGYVSVTRGLGTFSAAAAGAT